MDVLCRERLIVHEQKVDIFGIVDNEGLVAGRHEMPSLLIGTVSDLNRGTWISFYFQRQVLRLMFRQPEKQAVSVAASFSSTTQ